jgi:hypothetical protein
MAMMSEEKLVLFLPKRSIMALHDIVTRQILEAQIDLERGISSEDQSLISSSEAELRCLDPIAQELNQVKAHI